MGEVSFLYIFTAQQVVTVTEKLGNTTAISTQTRGVSLPVSAIASNAEDATFLARSALPALRLSTDENAPTWHLTLTDIKAVPA